MRALRPLFLALVIVGTNLVSAPSHALDFRSFCEEFIFSLESKTITLNPGPSGEPELTVTEVKDLGEKVRRIQADPDFNISTTHVDWMATRANTLLKNLSVEVRERATPSNRETLITVVNDLETEVLKAEHVKHFSYQKMLVLGHVVAEIYGRLSLKNEVNALWGERILNDVRIAWSADLSEECQFCIGDAGGLYVQQLYRRLTTTRQVRLSNPYAFIDLPLEENTPIEIVNMMFVDGLLPNLIAHAGTYVDGHKNPPSIVLDHDINHNVDIRTFFSENPHAYEVLKRVYRLIQQLGGEDLILANVVFFIYTHEIIYRIESEKQLFKTIRNRKALGHFGFTWNYGQPVDRFQKGKRDLEGSLPARLQGRSRPVTLMALDKGRRLLEKFLDQVTAP